MILNEKQEEAIRQVKDYIDSLQLQKVSVKELIKISGLSRDKLNNGFRELIGTTPYNYQVQQSMKKAAVLLRQGILIKSVALALGYKSPGNFTRAFRNEFKVAPSQYQTDIRQQ